MNAIPFVAALALVLVVVRLLSAAVSRMGQPTVIAEMAAGLLLGQAVFGAFAPEVFAFLFPPANLNGLKSVGECGVVLFVYLVGAEIRQQMPAASAMGSAAVKIASFSFVLPFALGLALSPTLYLYAPAGVAFWPFALFVSLTLSATAVPVMARILKERDAVGSDVGTAALSAATLSDAAIWICLPAILAASAGGGRSQTLLISLAQLCALALTAYAILRPALAAFCARRSWDDDAAPLSVGTLMTGAILCAAVTDWFGFHSLFGAILFGLATPPDPRVLRAIERVLLPVTGTILLPCFFVSAGLSTSTSGWGDTSMLLLLPLLLAGIVGKVAGGAFGSILSGHSWQSAFAIGALMNTRGMMEVVIAKMGLDAAVIGGDLFTVFILIAVITTAMTVPMIRLGDRLFLSDRSVAGAAEPMGFFASSRVGAKPPQPAAGD